MVTSTSNLKSLTDKKIIEYPIGLAKTAIDEYGHKKQLMIFKIISDKKSSKLKGDTGSAAYTASDVTGTGNSSQAVNPKTDDPKYLEMVSNAGPKDTITVLDGVVELSRVIVLPMPNDHSVNTAVEYDANYKSSGLTKAADIANQNGGAVLAEYGRLAGTNAFGGAINSLKAGLVGGGEITNEQSLLAAQGLAINPKKEVMFTGFNYRQFTFSYFFAPKNKNESDTVNDIIRTFRYYALPEISPAKLFYMFPAQFDISFMFGQDVNPNIPRIAKSVLARVGVNYSPSGTSWVTLPNGSPVAIQMTLEFIETELIDRNRVSNDEKPLSAGY